MANIARTQLGSGSREKYRTVRQLKSAPLERRELAVFGSDDREVIVERFALSDLSAEDRTAFKIRAQALAGVVTPHMARVIDHGVEGNEVRLVSTYVPGAWLDELAAAEGRMGTHFLALTVELRIVLDVLAALTAMHGYKGPGSPLMHGAIAPCHLLVGVDGHTRLAGGLRHKPVSRRIVAYQAPEVLLGDGTADARADLYSVAALMWEAMSGDRLFHEPDPHAILSRQLAGPMPRAVVREQWAEPLIDIVAKCLSIDPAHRCSSAAEIASAIRMAAQSRLAAPTRVGRMVESLVEDDLLRRKRQRIENPPPSSSKVAETRAKQPIPVPDSKPNLPESKPNVPGVRAKVESSPKMPASAAQPVARASSTQLSPLPTPSLPFAAARPSPDLGKTDESPAAGAWEEDVSFDATSVRPPPAPSYGVKPPPLPSQPSVSEVTRVPFTSGGRTPLGPAVAVARAEPAKDARPPKPEPIERVPDSARTLTQVTQSATHTIPKSNKGHVPTPSEPSIVVSAPVEAPPELPPTIPPAPLARAAAEAAAAAADAEPVVPKAAPVPSFEPPKNSGLQGMPTSPAPFAVAAALALEHSRAPAAAMTTASPQEISERAAMRKLAALAPAAPVVNVRMVGETSDPALEEAAAAAALARQRSQRRRRTIAGVVVALALSLGTIALAMKATSHGDKVEPPRAAISPATAVGEPHHPVAATPAPEPPPSPAIVTLSPPVIVPPATPAPPRAREATTTDRAVPNAPAQKNGGRRKKASSYEPEGI